MKNILLLVVSIILVLISCKSDTTSSVTTAETTVEVSFVPRVNNQPIVLNKLYPFQGKDSIMVSRLDFYVQYPYFTSDKNETYELNNVSLISFANQNTKIKQVTKPTASSFVQFNFIAGLDDMTNSTNPTSVSDTNPLHSSFNMYWTEWTKYRFIVFEGTIKREDNKYINFAYHTGLQFKKESLVKNNFQISQGKSNTISCFLNIEKIFFPADGNNLKVLDGEDFSHADPSDIVVTMKFLTNFSNAFSI